MIFSELISESVQCTGLGGRKEAAIYLQTERLTKRF